MKKSLQNFVAIILLLLMVMSFESKALGYIDNNKMTLEHFKIECENGYMPGELLICMTEKVDIQEFINSIPDIDIEHIEVLIESLGNSTVFHLFLIDKTEVNLFKTAEKLLMRDDVKIVSPNAIHEYLNETIPSIRTALPYLLSKYGDSNWDEAKYFDLNNDCIIDIEDLILLYANM